jgi:hypothetical protein
VRRSRTTSRVLLLIVVALMAALIVLWSAVELLPAPPGPPTPTAPFFLDRPEGLPRLAP